MGQLPGRRNGRRGVLASRQNRTSKFGTVTRLRLHLATALLAVLGIVPGSLSQTYNPAQNPYDAKALELRQGFAEATGPAKAVALARSYALRNYLTDTSALTHWFEARGRD